MRKRNLQYLPISGIRNERQSGEVAEQAGGGAVDQGNQQEQKHSAIQTHEHIQPNAISRIECPLQQVGENEQHIENYGLHSVESHIPAEILVPDDDEIESEEDEKAVEGEALEDPNRGDKRLDQGLEGGELRDDVFAVLDAVEEGVEVDHGRD